MIFFQDNFLFCTREIENVWNVRKTAAGAKSNIKNGKKNMLKAILIAGAAHFLFQFILIFEAKPNAMLVFCENFKEIFP